MTITDVNPCLRSSGKSKLRKQFKKKILIAVNLNVGLFEPIVSCDVWVLMEGLEADLGWKKKLGLNLI